MPVLAVVLTKHFRWLKKGTDRYEEALAEAPSGLFRYLISDRFYRRFYSYAGYNEKSLFSFLCGFFEREVAHALKIMRGTIKTDALDPLPPPLPPAYFDTLPASVECRLFLAELPKYIATRAWEVIVKEMVFDDTEQAVARTILDAVVGFKFVPYRLLSETTGWNLDRLEFMAEHVQLCLRWALHEIKPEIDAMPMVSESNSGTVLSAIVQDYTSCGLHFTEALAVRSAEPSTLMNLVGADRGGRGWQSDGANAN